MTARKAIDLRRHEQARPGILKEDEFFQEAMGQTLDPELIAIFDEEFQRLLDVLGRSGFGEFGDCKNAGLQEQGNRREKGLFPAHRGAAVTTHSTQMAG